MKSRRFLFLLLITVAAFCPSISAQEISISAHAMDHAFDGSSLPVQKFHSLENKTAHFDNGKWIAVKLEIPTTQNLDDHFIYLSYSLLDTVELWATDEHGELGMLYQTGQAFPFDTRPYSSSDFVFPVQSGTYVYYLRIYSSKPIVLPFQLVSTQDLVNSLTTKDFLFGIYIGIMLVMFLYNAALFLVTRDKSYAYYILFLFTLALAQAALFGYTDRFILANWPLINLKYAALSGAIVGIFTSFFVVHFLQLRRSAPVFAKLIYAIIPLELLGIILLVSGWDALAYHWVSFVSLYGSVVGIIAAVKLFRTGFQPAVYFLYGWSIFLLSVIVFALNNLDIIPYNPVLRGSMLYGSSIEVVLLSIALADRINILQREREKSQKKALEMTRENARIIREINTQLEEKVQLRTEELQQTNKDLKNTLAHLKATHTKLAQSEKMASLGVLTAGVAHELNNPLNYIYGGYSAIQEEVKKEGSEFDKQSLTPYLEWIKVGAEKAIQIVKSLNIYSRSNESQMENCDMNAIIEASVQILQHKIRGQIELQKELDSNLKSIKGNNGKLHQVLLNITGNAIDALEGKGSIRLVTRNVENGIECVIADNGSGISDENMKQIFDPFFTTKAPGSGTGLGLSIVQSIIREHGGRIEINSKLNQGTEVTIFLPNA